MKLFFTVLLLFNLMYSPVFAQEKTWNNTNSDTGGPLVQPEVIVSSSSVEDNDPFEPVNRFIFAFNDFLDTVIFDPVSVVYTTLLPKAMREHIGNVLQNLSEPIVLANNILQGEPQDAEDTIRRFLINSTVGLGGVIDVSTYLEIPYKKEDFGLTLACWGFDAGPYVVIPVLGPSNVRDAVGRIVDFAGDPFNWVAYIAETVIYSNSRTCAQIIDVKADSEIIAELKKSIDPYATFRTWYHERRLSLIAKGDRQIIDSPRPD